MAKLPHHPAYFDDAPLEHGKAIPQEDVFNYLLGKVEAERAEKLLEGLQEGMVVDQVIATLAFALASYIQAAYPNDEEVGCAKSYNVSLFMHAVMHQCYAIPNKEDSDGQEN